MRCLHAQKLFKEPQRPLSVSVATERKQVILTEASEDWVGLRIADQLPHSTPESISGRRVAASQRIRANHGNAPRPIDPSLCSWTTCASPT